jgi:hypothetical protein
VSTIARRVDSRSIRLATRLDLGQDVRLPLFQDVARRVGRRCPELFEAPAHKVEASAAIVSHLDNI